MFTLNLAGVAKDFEKVSGTDVNDPFPFLSKEDREAGDFPTFFQIMQAKTPEELADISLEQVILLLQKIPKYSGYLETKANPMHSAVPRLREAKSHTPRRRVL